MFDVKVSAYTDKGDIREVNQDRILYRYGEINGYFIGLYVVADGCGGLEDGGAASKIIVDYFEDFWTDAVRVIAEEAVDEFINETLDKAIDDVNRACHKYTEDYGKKTGSTLSLLFTVNDIFYIRNLGDSRIYKTSLFGMKRLTVDQNIVSNMLISGQITKKQAKNYKQKNKLTMCVGYYKKVYPYRSEGRIKNKDVFLLCSDGLYNFLTEDNMFKIIKNGKYTFDEKAYMMRENIDHGNAKDNVSCIIVKYIL